MKIKSLIFLSVLLIGLIQTGFVMNVESITFIVGIISYLLMFYVYIIYRKLEIDTDIDYFKFIKLYLVLGIIAIFRGLFQAQNYWDWKFLILDSILVMFIPLVSFIGSEKNVVQAIYFNFFRYLVPFSIVVFFLSKQSIYTDGFARYLSPIYLIIIFFPLLTKKVRIYIIILAFISFISDFGSRSNMIRIIVSACLMLIYYFQVPIQKRLIQVIHISLFVVPTLLFILAATDVFNVFSIGDDYGDEYVVKKKLDNGQFEEEDMSADTRTGLYKEVIESGLKRHSIIFGESANSGYISEWFAEASLGTKGRVRSEVCILNVFNVFGIVGVIVFSLIFYFASYLCVYYSNNNICKIIGLFIAFRWTYSWIEEFFDLSMNFFFMWLIIGLCFSKAFRDMDEESLKKWVLGIFDKKLIADKSYIIES